MEEATIKQGKLHVRFLRCVPPASEGLDATSSHRVLLTQALPPADRPQEQPDVPISPENLPQAGFSKQEPQGRGRCSHRRTTARPGLSAAPLTVSVFFICSLPAMVLTYADGFQITPKCCTEESEYQGLFPTGSTDKNIPGLAPFRLQSPLTPGLRLQGLFSDFSPNLYLILDTVT